MTPTHCVLIVDALDETRAVLRTALERKGLKILEAKRPVDGLKLLRQRDPDLVVMDLEFEDSAGQIESEGIAAESHERNKPLLVLGSARQSDPPLPGRQFMSKPYHYAPLIRKIEELLGAARQPAV